MEFQTPVILKSVNINFNNSLLTLNLCMLIFTFMVKDLWFSFKISIHWMYLFVFISLKQCLKQYFDLFFYFIDNSNEMSLHRIYKANCKSKSHSKYHNINTPSVFCCPSCLIGANLILMRLISHQVSKITRWSWSSGCTFSFWR